MEDVEALGGKLVDNGAPILIGVTGKRDLHGHDEALATSLGALFDRLDKALPRSPKVLVSGLAAGADSIAAEVALGRHGWSVFAPLPFERAIYEEDFDVPADLERLRGLLANPRVHVIALRPLRKPDSHEAYGLEDLHRAEPAPEHRTLHYEQLGLFIADNCALLIAVTNAGETPDRVGGTARVVQSRLSDADDIALAVRARSEELVPESPLEAPRTGPVWRIELPDEASETPLPITIELPDRAPQPLRNSDAFRASLRLALVLEDFNRRAATLAGQQTRLAQVAPTERLKLIRARLSDVQGRMRRRIRFSVWFIAAFFCIAVAGLEAHIAFALYCWAKPLSLVYFIGAMVGVGVYLAARLRRWQSLAEDYRAISEALRAQMVLWQAGCGRRRERVDLRYLKGERGALKLVRATIVQLVEGAHIPPGDLTEDFAQVEAWINGQVDFYTRRISARKGFVSFTETTSWFLFLSSLAVSACFTAILIKPLSSILTPQPPAGQAWAHTVVCAVVSLVGVSALFGLAWWIRRGDEDQPSVEQPVLVRLGVPVLAALGAGWLLSRAAVTLVALLPDPPIHCGALCDWRYDQGEEVLVMLSLVIAACAGGLRFVAEKLSWASELEGYENARAFFRRARVKLARPISEQARKALVSDLVNEALKENETWLIAHRERPLEPVLGA